MKTEKSGSNIRERTFQYALRSISLYQALDKMKDPVGKIIGKQYLRSATSIGANIEEAQSGESRADFIHKYSISQKEAKESLYWLRLLHDSNVVASDRLQPIIKETEELIAIISTIIVNTKKNHPEK